MQHRAAAKPMIVIVGLEVAAHLADPTPRGDHPDVPIIIRLDANYFDENIFEVPEDPEIGHLGGG